MAPQSFLFHSGRSSYEQSEKTCYTSQDRSRKTENDYDHRLAPGGRTTSKQAGKLLKTEIIVKSNNNRMQVIEMQKQNVGGVATGVALFGFFWDNTHPVHQFRAAQESNYRQLYRQNGHYVFLL